MSFPGRRLLFVFGFCVVAGCSSSKGPSDLIAESNQSNVRRLSNLYMMYQSQHQWKGPKDEKEFKSFIQKADPGTLQPMGVNPNDLDKLFTSERDGQPFKVRYGVQGGMGVTVAVVFEQAGSGGKKQVGFTGMVVEEVDDARSQELFAAKVDKNAGRGKAAPPSQPGRPTGAPPGALENAPPKR